MQLVQMIVGLTKGRQLRARTPLEQVASELERCAEAANVRAGLAHASSGGGGGGTDGRDGAAAPRECTVCMAEPRAVRFMCGHMVCCEQCTDELMSRRGQNTCPACRTRIVVAARGAHLAAQHTFVRQPAAARGSFSSSPRDGAAVQCLPAPIAAASNNNNGISSGDAGGFVDLGAANSRASSSSNRAGAGLRRSASGLARVFSFGRRQGRTSGR